MGKLNIEDHVSIICESKDHNLAEQLWLEGFKKICNGVELLGPSINTYCELQYTNIPPFRAFVSGDFHDRHKKIINKQITPIFLPVNDNYHLAFWLDYGKDNEGFGDVCKIFFEPIPWLKNMVYPSINLRPSMVYPKGNVPDTIELEGISQSTVDAFFTNVEYEILTESYNAFDYLIDYAKNTGK